MQEPGRGPIEVDISKGLTRRQGAAFTLMPAMFDLLKIRYLLVLEDGAYEKTSLFQGFSHAWPDLHWALHLLPELPADVLEPTQPRDGLIAQRIGGERQLVWIPIDVSALEQESASFFGAFTVCFSGDPVTAERVESWISRQDTPVFHLRLTNQADSLHLEAFSTLELRDYCRSAYDVNRSRFSLEQQGAIEDALANWSRPSLLPTGHPPFGHNIFLANQMSLRRALHDAKAREAWIGETEEDYTTGIVESVSAVLSLRDEIGVWNFHRLMLLTPALILAEPALYRLSYKAIKASGPYQDRILRQTLRLIQTQRGLSNQVDETYVQGVQGSNEAQALFGARARELTTFMLALGLRAASTNSAVMRLSPGVNHVFPKLDNYARNIRSDRAEARMKSRRLFESIQNDLANVIGPDRLALLRDETGPIKLVCDCPLEWLEVDGLPLSLARDCSRINATPGNVMIMQLAQTQAVDVPPEAFRSPLIVSSFAEDDPLRNVMRDALIRIRSSNDEPIAHEFRRVESVDEFVAIMNAYEGAMVIFDGHGAVNKEDPVGTIIIGGEKIDVWQLRNRVRVPPIVLLSACDTQAADASSHATVANGFLALGAKTVVATLLPVGGYAAALFAARFLLRLKDFLPAAAGSGWRALSWTEVVSGMLRMTLVSEILDVVIGPMTSPSRQQRAVRDLQVQANVWINSRELDWYDRFIAELAALVGKNESSVRAKASGVIARSEAVRYIQLGNPEMIRIVDDRLQETILQGANETG